jgi:hypothetical protein
MPLRSWIDLVGLRRLLGFASSAQPTMLLLVEYVGKVKSIASPLVGEAKALTHLFIQHRQ